MRAKDIRGGFSGTLGKTRIMVLSMLTIPLLVKGSVQAGGPLARLVPIASNDKRTLRCEAGNE